MAGLSTTLPQNLRAPMEEGRVEQALAELSRCEIGAREGRGATALHITPCPDELVRRLVERGEDINAADDHGRRPLHERACWARKDQIGLLLELGAEVDAPDEHGRTPLHVAAEGLCPPAVDALLAAGARPAGTRSTTPSPSPCAGARTTSSRPCSRSSRGSWPPAPAPPEPRPPSSRP